jgi:alkyldihydroxyacetonephosphate synthase
MDNNATWTSWGGERPELSRPARAFLTRALGPLTPQPATPIERATLPESRLAADVRAQLVEALGADSVLDDAVTRAQHAGGQSYLDLIRRRRGDAADAPDAVLAPSTTSVIARILEICSTAQVAVVPWGGGTSVVGGLSSLRGHCTAVVALDLSKLDRLLSVDQISMTATFEPGIRTPAAEAALAANGLALGHVPQSFERASLGGYVVTRSSGQASSGNGRIDDMVVGAKLVAPAGELDLPALPGSAAGPDLRRLILGSEGTLGIVTEVTLRVKRVPEIKRYEGWVAKDWDAGTRVMRHIAQAGAKPDIARLSDPAETRVSLALSGTPRWQKRGLAAWLRARGIDGGCMIIVGFEGEARDVAYRRRLARRTLRSEGTVPIGASAGNSWARHRFSGAYLRDTLLDEGALVETLETATTWSKLPGLYAAVGAALSDSLQRGGVKPLVGCHISHLYPTGASLYFTVLAAAEAGRESEQWGAAKLAANRAIVDAGGTASHHHAVGTAHRDIVVHDLGGVAGVGVKALRAIKDRLDPAGILNPGKLLP